MGQAGWFWRFGRRKDIRQDADLPVCLRIRTPEEIAAWQEMNLPAGQTGLAGYWKLNEGTGDTASDQSGKGHGGLLSDAQWAQGVDLTSIGIEDPIKEYAAKRNPLYWYPNPCSETLTIGCHLDRVNVQLTDIQGKILRRFQVRKSKTALIDLSDCPDGIYILQSLEGVQTCSGNFIIKQ